MRQSSAEFGQLLFKAARGVGLPLGLAEDLVAPILWLQTCGLPGDVEAVNMLTGLDERRVPGVFPDLTIRPDENTTANRTLSAIYLAAAGCDSLQLGWPGTDAEIQMTAVDSPLFTATALSLAHRKLNADFILTVRTAGHVLSSNQKGEVICIKRNGQEPETLAPETGDIQLSASKNLENTANGAVLVDADREIQFLLVCESEGLSADENNIRRLQSLADRLLVPESQHSLKYGAGAGIVDTD